MASTVVAAAAVEPPVSAIVRASSWGLAHNQGVAEGIAQMIGRNDFAEAGVP